MKAQNLVHLATGRDSLHSSHFQAALDAGVDHGWEVRRVVGVLAGLLDDLESGFLLGHEQLVAGIVFDSMLEESKSLLASESKDPAAVLVRVVVEDSLRRLCRDAGLSDSGKASALNDALKNHGRYAQPQWRIIQSWLDIGNAAAHGKFDDYTADQVGRMIEDVRRFMAQEFPV